MSPSPIGDDAAVAQHDDAVAEAQHLLELGRDEEHRHAVLGEVDDELLDLGLGADVDAARRLVEDEQPGRGGEPAREQHLLLVAAREVAHERVGVAGTDVERLDVRWRQLVLALLRDRAEPAAVGLQRQRDVVAHGEVADDALVAAVLRGERDAVRDACRGVRSSSRSPWIANLPVSARSMPQSSRASSVRPEPSRPARPTTSPASIGRSTGSIAPLATEHRRLRRARRSDSSTTTERARRSRSSSTVELLADHLLHEVDASSSR